MNLFAKFGLGAAMLVGFAFAPAAYADSWSHAGHSQSSHSSPSSGVHGGAPRGYSGPMPSRGFRSAPPGFHGATRDFRAGATPYTQRNFGGMARRDVGGGPTHGLRSGASHDFQHAPFGQAHGTFHGHDFSHFTSQERETWQNGSWRHSWHNGHFGWWWFCDDFWFFYPEPIYPYPTYIGTDYYYDSNEYDDSAYGSDYSWYWCDDPQGYYPYVQQCNDDWQPVSPTPPPPGHGYDNRGGYNDQNDDSGPDGNDDGPNQ